MAHLIRWENTTKTVVFQQYTINPGKDDLYQLAQKSADMLNSVPHTVHLIIDERNFDLVLTTPDINYLEKLAPANQGAVVMVLHRMKVNYKRLVQNLALAIAPNAFGHPYYTTSIEQARQFLQEKYGVEFDNEAQK